MDFDFNTPSFPCYQPTCSPTPNYTPSYEPPPDPWPSNNPANGLPMVPQTGIDVDGNPFGTSNG